MRSPEKRKEMLAMSTIKHLTDADFETETAGKTCLLDFWATWCGPCRMFAPILEETAATLPDEVVVGKIDVDQNPDLAVKFGIRAIPTIVILKNGQIKETMMGVQDKSKLLAALKD